MYIVLLGVSVVTNVTPPPLHPMPPDFPPFVVNWQSDCWLGRAGSIHHHLSKHGLGVAMGALFQDTDKASKSGKTLHVHPPRNWTYTSGVCPGPAGFSCYFQLPGALPCGRSPRERASMLTQMMTPLPWVQKAGLVDGVEKVYTFYLQGSAGTVYSYLLYIIQRER